MRMMGRSSTSMARVTTTQLAQLRSRRSGIDYCASFTETAPVTSSYAQGIHAPREKAFLPRCAFKGQELMGDTIVKPGDVLTITRSIRSQKTGLLLPRQGIFVSAIENLGRQLILVNFDSAGLEYLFPSEIVAQSPGVKESLAVSY